MAKILENIKDQRAALNACLISGTHKAGYQATGVSRKTWERFLLSDQAFAKEVQGAINKGKVLRSLKYSGGLTVLAVKLARQRLEDGTASDRLILALLPLALINNDDDFF